MARARKKRNIDSRMQLCSDYWFTVPVANKGKWRDTFQKKDAPLYLELGCGKGKFACEFAAANPDICYVAMEKDESVILGAIEKAAFYGISNLRFLRADAETLRNYFAPGEVDRIFIHFCDPWMRKSKPKRRLTYRERLEVYREILKEDGQIHFKTDEPRLFLFSLEEFCNSGYLIDKLTLNLHESPWNCSNITTEFETKFAREGFPIYRLEAHKKESSCVDLCKAIPPELEKFRNV